MIKLSGITTSGGYVTFNMVDCPVRVYDNMVALTARPNSELVYAETIVRRDMESGATEGDIVFNKDGVRVGYVLYSRGFKVANTEGGIEEYDKYMTFNKEKGGYDSRARAICNRNRSKLIFYYGDYSFTYKALVMRTLGGELVISKQDKQYIEMDVRHIRMWTGVKDICFGDSTEKGVVILHNGRVAYKKGKIILTD